MSLAGEIDNRILFGAALVLILITISWIDITHYRIPNWLNASLAVIGFSWQFSIDHSFIMFQVLFAVALGLAMFLMRYLYFLRSGHHGLGLGDVKMAGAAALWIAPQNLPIFIFLSSSAGLVFAITNVHFNRTRLIPFGPFLAFGLFVTWFWENL